MRSSKVRQALLGLTALVFTGVAVGSVIAPHEMAAGLGYALDNVDALNEFRAIYVGLWLATAGLLVVAARRVDERFTQLGPGRVGVHGCAEPT